MKLIPASANSFYDNYPRYKQRIESENGRWTFTLDYAGFDVRLKIGITNSLWFVCDYSCGLKPKDITEIYQVMKVWFESFDESINESDLTEIAPDFDQKTLTTHPDWQNFKSQILTKCSTSF